MKDKPRSLLLMEMGLGKTIATLTTITDLIDSGEVEYVLILAPLRVVNSVWEQEARQWEHTRHLTFSRIVGTPQQRLEAYNTDVEVYLINYENLIWLLNTIDEFPFDMVVFDEGSKMKSTKSKRYKAWRKVAKYPDRVVSLTGSPASNGLLDFYGVVSTVDQGKRLGRTFTIFRDKYFIGDFQGWSWELRNGAEEQIHNAVKDIALSMQAEDYLDLPDRINNTITITLPPPADKLYRELEREFLIELANGTDISAPSAATLSNKLRQVVNGCVYDEDGKFHELHNAKLDALEDVFEEAAGRPLLVFYQYRSDLSRIQSKFKQAVKLDNDPEIIERWNRKEIPILLAHPASAGFGINLQRGSNILCWFGLTWSLEEYEQANARLHRQGQNNHVICHHIIASGTIDHKVSEALQTKRTVQQALLNSMKEAA